MKKIISLVLSIIILVTIAATTTSCGEIVECDSCLAEDRESRMHEVEIWGSKVILCGDCYNELQEFANSMNN